MKTNHVCPKCRGNRILLIDEVADMGEFKAEVRPLHIARVPVSVGSDDYCAVGKLGAAVCRACGYTELHVHSPGSIPIDRVHVREVIGPAQPGPYR